MPSVLALDKQQVSDQNNKSFPALDPRWKDDIRFVTYQAPPTDLSDRGVVEEWADRLKFIQDDLHTLLQMPHQKFWCQAIFDESLHSLIDTYLRFAPRTYDVIYELPSEYRGVHDEVHRLIFFTCLRMATHKESKENFLSPKVFGEILYANFLFDIPKLFDICVLYGEGNSQLIAKMVENIFTQQPNYMEDLRLTIPTLLQVFHSIEEKCGIQEKSPEHSPQKLGSPRADNPVLDTMTEAALQDVVFYLADISITLSVFVEIYPPAAQVFSENNFIQRLASFYDAIFPKIIQTIKKKRFEDVSLQRLFYQKMSQCKKGVMKLVHLTLNHCFIHPIVESREPVESYVENFLELMATLLNERRFLADFESCHCFQDYTDVLMQSSYEIDPTRIQYIQDAFSSAFATYGKRRAPTGATNQGGRTSPDGSPGLEDEGGASGGYKPSSTSIKPELLGACAAAVTGVELDSIITSVQDLLPDLGPGFIELCLEEMDYSVEKVINAVLEDKLPPSLQDIERQLQREPKPSEDTVISSRANVYDHDEFDVFSRGSVDMSRVFKGKQSKTDTVTLDEARGFDEVKQKISQAYSIRVETVEGDDPSQMTELYDDEYDDTYDANNVGADDADSADELTSRRPFTTPRVLGGKTVKSESEEDSNSEESEEDSKPRDEFITNPALIRQRNEERAQWKAMRRGQGQRPQGQRPQGRGRGQGQEGGERRYDVKGRGRGHGQSDEVLRNRRWKEQHKSSRGNHNRRFMSDKKRMGFGAPPK